MHVCFTKHHLIYYTLLCVSCHTSNFLLHFKLSKNFVNVTTKSSFNKMLIKIMKKSGARRGPCSTSLRYVPLDYGSHSGSISIDSYNNNQMIKFVQLRHSLYILHISFYIMLQSVITSNPLLVSLSYR